MLKPYLVPDKNGVTVILVDGIIPSESLGEVSSEISPNDYKYVREYDGLIYLDLDLKAEGMIEAEDQLEMKAMEDIRLERDKRLRACDFTQLPDVPLSSEKKIEYTLYRQALRDFPENVIDIFNPIFPNKPE